MHLLNYFVVKLFYPNRQVTGRGSAVFWHQRSFSAKPQLLNSSAFKKRLFGSKKMLSEGDRQALRELTAWSERRF